MTIKDNLDQVNLTTLPPNTPYVDVVLILRGPISTKYYFYGDLSLQSNKHGGHF